MSDAETITDAKGRVLTLRSLTALDQARLLRAAGPMQAANQPYFNMVECAAMVAELDGVPVSLPVNERQIDALIDRLGDDGMAAVMVRRTQKIMAVMKEAEDAATGGGNPDPLDRSAS